MDLYHTLLTPINQKMFTQSFLVCHRCYLLSIFVTLIDRSPRESINNIKTIENTPQEKNEKLVVLLALKEVC